MARAALLSALAAFLSALAPPGPPATAQPSVPSEFLADAPDVAIPNYWDPRRRPEQPDGAVGAIRFMTEPDYPPFSFTASDGRLIGFNVDLARALCRALEARCTIQTRPWDTLVPALEEERGDAVIASLSPSAELRTRIGLTERYLANPARFVARSEDAPGDPSRAPWRDLRLGVREGTAHEAYLEAFFEGNTVVAFEDEAAARRAVREGEVDALFADGISLAFWLNGEGSRDCCVFVGGPYTESAYFGEGMAIGVRRDARALREALNYALWQVHESGDYAELYLKYFPIGFY